MYKTIWENLLRSSWTIFFLVILLMCFAAPLRFINLGYADYIGDEHKAFLQLEPNQTVWDFFMTRRKGPMQFLVSYIPYLVTHDFRNEYAERLPFAIISVLSVGMFYLAIRKLTKNSFVAFFSTVLFSINGFIVGFGRIAQYQNINLFFSFLAIWAFCFVLDKNLTITVKVRYTVLAVIAFCISLLSHWDAVFVIPPLLYISIKYLRDVSFSKREKIMVIAWSIFTALVILLPFIIPYLSYHQASESNQSYLNRRIGNGWFNTLDYLVLFRLYNPFFVVEVVLALVTFSVVALKKNYYIWMWFIANFLFFELLFKKPGTHIYNFVIPALVLAGYSLWFFWHLHRTLRVIVIIAFTIITALFYYQSYTVFVDHSKEYPYEQKIIFTFGKKTFTTPLYTGTPILPLFGFPHYRMWNDVNAYINDYVKENNLPKNISYITNEDLTVSEWYMDLEYGQKSQYFAIGVKRPGNYSKDYRFPQIGKKRTIKIFERDGNEMVRVYFVNNTPNKLN